MLVKMDTQADIDKKEKQQKKETRKAEILTRLSEIDVTKIRPLSAVALKREKKEDTKKLSDLEDESKTLRDELQTLVQ